MHRLMFAILSGVLVSLGSAAEPPPIRVAVTGDRVCLRAEPLDRAEVVCQVSTNDTLEAYDLSAEWVPVVPPVSAVMFVSAAWVSNGVVTGNDVYVRCGPGQNYPPLGYVQKGDRVGVRGNDGAWLRVAPPPGVMLWVNRRYVSQRDTVPPQPLVVAGIPSSPDSKGQPYDNRCGGEPAKVGAEVANPPLAAVSGKGNKADISPTLSSREVSSGPENVSEAISPVTVVSETAVVIPSDSAQCLPVYIGIVDRCEWLIRRPADYRIIRQGTKDRQTTVCFVSGESEQLRRLQGKSVRVSGIPLGMHDTRIPIVSAGNITIVEQ
jgi:uncharacterized protein YgiM (DUF1202 family)